MSARPCPICNKPTSAQHAPFCSERCQLLDLNHWFTGAYATPAMEMDDPDEESMTTAGSSDPSLH